MVGRLDWQRMLDEITPQEFAQWQALEFIDGWGCGWQQAATVATAANNVGLRIVASMVGSDAVDQSEFRQPSDYIPDFREPPPVAKPAKEIEVPRG